jgi:hypothetical protein
MKNITNIQIEDEKHFLLHCKKFNTQRNIFRYNNNSKSFLIFKQFDMKEEVNLRIEYDLFLNKKLILLLAFL